MLKNILPMIIVIICLTSCSQPSFMIDYDDAGGLESWKANDNGTFSSTKHGEISFDTLVNTIARNVLKRLQHITFCSQVNDASFAIYTCDETYEKAYIELQTMQASLFKAFKNQSLTINIDDSPVTLNGLSTAELINTLNSTDIAFADAEKTLMLYFVLDDWMKEDAITGISEALSIYHYQKNYYVGDETNTCNQQDEIKALHAWMLGSYLYANDLPLKVNYTNFKTAESFFNSALDKRDHWSMVMDSAISQSILHENLHFRLPARILINAEGEAVIYRLHKNVAAAGIDLKVGDKILGFNNFVGGLHSAEQQNAEMLKALSSDKLFHWKIQRDDKTFIVTIVAKDTAAPIEDTLITQIFKTNHQSLHYLKLDSFVYGFEEHIDAALTELAKQPANNLIIDLRANGGGSNETLLYLLNTLFPDEKQPFRMIVRENGILHESEIPLKAIPQFRYYKHHYILLDAWSLSASEQFAHAVQHRDDVTVLSNTNTHGKRISNHTWQGNCGKSYQLVTSFGVNSLGRLLPKSGITADITVSSPYRNLFYTSIKDPFIKKVMHLNKQKTASENAQAK